MRTAEEFRNQAFHHGIWKWVVPSCSTCLEQVRFYFFSHPEASVVLDNSCACFGLNPRASSWQEVADYYNRQTNPDFIKEMDSFWKFDVKEPSPEMSEFYKALTAIDNQVHEYGRNPNYMEYYQHWAYRVDKFLFGRKELLRMAYPGTKKHPLKGKALGNFLKDRFKNNLRSEL